MTPDWVKRIKTAKDKSLDITKPVEVGDPMNDLRAPLPDPALRERQRKTWDWYGQKARWRQWLTKPRQT